MGLSGAAGAAFRDRDGRARWWRCARQVRRSDLGKLVQGIGRLLGRTPARGPGGDTDGRFVYTDPAGILDAGLRQRLENWPSAMHGDGVVRPAELWSIKSTREGLIVLSVSWWGSAPALDHQLGLAVDIANRLTAKRPATPEG